MNIRDAARLLIDSGAITEFRVSGIYETEPWGNASGGPFLNCVMVGKTTLTADELLSLCQSIETGLGSRIEKLARPRRIDIDLLFVEDCSVDRPGLTIPHPRMHLRMYVLVPLSDVWSKEVPGLGADPEQLLRGCADGSRVDPIRAKPDRGELWKR